MNPLPPAPQGFGQPLALGTPLPKGVTNKQVRFVGQPLPTKQYFSVPAPGVQVQPGGKRRHRNKKTTKKRRNSRMRKTRRHR